MSIKMPAVLHEIFGEKQSLISLISILLFGGLLTTILFIRYPTIYRTIPIWRQILTFVLVFDIFSGCLANFTKSTNNYYAKHLKRQVLYRDLFLIIIFIKSGRQVFVGGLLLCLGITGILLLGMNTFMTIVSLLFLVKVLFSFSVDHYQKV